MSESFSYIDVVEDGNSIYCWTRNGDGELELFKEPARHFFHLFMPANTDDTPEYFDLYGRPMKKISFSSKRELRSFAKRHHDIHESDVGLVYKFLVEHFSDTSIDAPYNIGYYDIEVDYDLDDGRGYPSIHDPFGEINAISLFDKAAGKYVEIMLTGHQIKLKDDDYPVECIVVSTEKMLLRELIRVVEDIDILAGWNTTEFDINYIMERMIINFGLDFAKTSLCRNGLEARKREYVNDFKEDTWTWVLSGRVHLDMMELYKKFIPKTLGSNSLNSVCLAVLGEEKLEYQGDLGELYRTNPQRFFEYSLHDSRLLLKLDIKLDLIKTAMTLARINCVLGTDVLGSVKPIEIAFMKFCRENGNVVLPDKKEPEAEEFKGAVVYDTISGLHGWSFSIDLTALYPSVMMMLGMSPETVIGQCLDWDKDFYRIIEREPVDVKLDFGDEVVVAPAHKIADMIKEEGMTISAAGTIYSGKMGMLAKFVEQGFFRRKQYKRQMFEAADRGDEAARVKFNLLQSVTKIGNNSIYGCVGQKSFRLFDIRMARSVTYTGAIISKRQAQSINDIVNKAVEAA